MENGFQSSLSEESLKSSLSFALRSLCATLFIWKHHLCYWMNMSGAKGMNCSNLCCSHLSKLKCSFVPCTLGTRGKMQANGKVSLLIEWRSRNSLTRPLLVKQCYWNFQTHQSAGYYGFDMLFVQQMWGKRESTLLTRLFVVIHLLAPITQWLKSSCLDICS